MSKNNPKLLRECPQLYINPQCISEVLNPMVATIGPEVHQLIFTVIQVADLDGVARSRNIGECSFYSMDFDNIRSAVHAAVASNLIEFRGDWDQLKDAFVTIGGDIILNPLFVSAKPFSDAYYDSPYYDHDTKLREEHLNPRALTFEESCAITDNDPTDSSYRKVYRDTTHWLKAINNDDRSVLDMQHWEDMDKVNHDDFL